eukprot:scaffold69985_cov33-Phaeocystis_antarctica.AAC.1
MAPIASCVAIVVSSGSTPFAACVEDNEARIGRRVMVNWPRSPAPLRPSGGSPQAPLRIPAFLRRPAFHKMARLESRDEP